MTYAVEAGSQLRSVFALRLFPDGSIMEQSDFLSLAGDAVSPALLWDRVFAGWAPCAIAAAADTASKIANRICGQVEAAYQEQLDRDGAAAGAWLMRRAIEIGGPVLRQTGDLFDPSPPQNDWRSCAIPEQRLAGLVADPSMPPVHRRDAAEALLRFRARTAEMPPFPRPVTRPLGMLMLVP
jgi:hypothetical protein